MVYKKYLIKDTDDFNPNDFPKLMEDLDMISIAMVMSPSAFTTDMLLSFLKDQGNKNEWSTQNPRLAEMICSKSLPLTDLKALFHSCSLNPSFSKQLEEYLKAKLNSPNLN